MSEIGLGLVLIAAAVLGGWLVRGSLRTGESIGRYFIDSTRSGNPILFWFDVVTFGLVTAMAALIGIVALSRSISL
jgi:hypothetical protein